MVDRRPRRGTVSHKAIELSVSWRGDPSAGELVDEAMARLIAGDARIGDWLGGLREGERAELHGEATERVNMFLECFPRLEPRWRPVAESRLRADLYDDRIVLSGKVDLTVGPGRGPAGRQGARRPEDRRLLAQPPRGPALLRPGRDAAPRRAARGCSPPTTSTAGACSRSRSSEALLRGALERVVRRRRGRGRAPPRGPRAGARPGRRAGGARAGHLRGRAPHLEREDDDLDLDRPDGDW